jgi:hypothetical protein
MADSRIEKWRRWCEDRIYPEVTVMHLYRDTFNEVGRIVGESDLPPSYFWRYLPETYSTTQAVAVRRQAEVSDRVVTLGRLLSEMESDAGRLSRRWFIDMWGWDDERMADETFSKKFAGRAGEHLDPAIPAADLAALQRGAASVKKYVDEHLAHSNKRPGAAIPTLNDVDAAVEAIGSTFQKYALLLTATDHSLKTVLTHEWRTIFRQPWAKGDLPRRGR